MLAFGLVSIYDIKGQRICSFGPLELSAGMNRLIWDLTDAHGGRVASGIYIVRARAGTVTARTRVTLVR